MWKTVVRRLLIMIPQLIILSLFIFVLAQFMPGDAIRGLIGPDVDPAMREQLMEMHGLNDPWYIQYTRWIRSIIFDQDLGMSIAHPGRSVTTIIGERVMNTVRLSIMTTLLIYLMAIPLGILAGRKHGRWPDKIILFYTFVALSMPTVVLALIMLLVFAFNLGWFPAMGVIDPRAIAEGGWAIIWSRMHHLILPSMVGALLGIIGIVYFLRNEIIDSQTSDYVTTARAKGVPEGKVYTRHILRNSMLPIAGGIGASIALVFAGSFFIETIFSFSGMGELFLTSLTQRDWPVANALIMFYAILGVIAGLLGDIVIMIVDPRIRIK